VFVSDHWCKRDVDGPLGVGLLGHVTAYQAAYVDGHAETLQDPTLSLVGGAVPHGSSGYALQEVYWQDWFE